MKIIIDEHLEVALTLPAKMVDGKNGLLAAPDSLSAVDNLLLSSYFDG